MVSDPSQSDKLPVLVSAEGEPGKLAGCAEESSSPGGR